MKVSILRQPVASVFNEHLIDYPAPSNLNASWNYGSLAGICLVLQIVTGIFLAMHYCPSVDYAFSSVQHIMRDVPNGWLLRYLHANGASLFFIAVYTHIFRGFYYCSYSSPREAVWLTGVVILLLMILTAFIGLSGQKWFCLSHSGYTPQTFCSAFSVILSGAYCFERGPVLRREGKFNRGFSRFENLDRGLVVVL